MQTTSTTSTKNSDRASRMLAVCAAFLLATAAVSAEESASSFIAGKAEEAIALLTDPDLTHEERARELETLARTTFDLETISKLVLARNWRSFDDDQQQRFRAEFERYLSRRYGTSIDRYSDERIEIVNERIEPRGDVTVGTRIVGGAADNVEVDYRLRNRGDGWRVIDVIVEGVSFVANYRSQFREVLRGGGPDHLIDVLRQKNADASATEDGA